MNAEEPATRPRPAPSPEVMSSMALSALGWALGPMLLRSVLDERRARDERWDDNALREQEFQLRMGFARAGDKDRFMRRHFGFPARGAGGRP